MIFEYKENYNDDKINKLAKVTKQNQKKIIENCFSYGQLIDSLTMTNKRKFNFLDFYYILCRSTKSSIMREWHLQLMKAFCLIGSVLLINVVYPDDIGSYPSCLIELSDQANLTELVYNLINGKRSKGELNASYLVIMFFGFGLIYIQCITFVFPGEIQVSLNNC